MFVLCHCGCAAVIRISTSQSNPDRRYYVCKHWKPKTSDGCGFFEWIDPRTKEGSSGRVESEGNFVEQTVDKKHSSSNEIVQDIARIKHDMNCIKSTHNVTNFLLLLIVVLLVVILIVLIVISFRLFAL